MTASGAASSPRSPLGHVLHPDWKQELDETQFARALLRIASHVVNDRAGGSSTIPTTPTSKKGGAP